MRPTGSFATRLIAATSSRQSLFEDENSSTPSRSVRRPQSFPVVTPTLTSAIQVARWESLPRAVAVFADPIRAITHSDAVVTSRVKDRAVVIIVVPLDKQGASCAPPGAARNSPVNRRVGRVTTAAAVELWNSDDESCRYAAKRGRNGCN
jgi:hypothetical protein